MKNFNLKLNVDNSKIIIEIPDDYIGGKIKVTIVPPAKKIKTQKTTDTTEIETPARFNKPSDVVTTTVDVIDDFPHWFQSNSLNDLDDSIDNI